MSNLKPSFYDIKPILVWCHFFLFVGFAYTKNLRPLKIMLFVEQLQCMFQATRLLCNHPDTERKHVIKFSFLNLFINFCCYFLFHFACNSVSYLLRHKNPLLKNKTKLSKYWTRFLADTLLPNLLEKDSTRFICLNKNVNHGTHF